MLIKQSLVDQQDWQVSQDCIKHETLKEVKLEHVHQDATLTTK